MDAQACSNHLRNHGILREPQCLKRVQMIWGHLGEHSVIWENPQKNERLIRGWGFNGKSPAPVHVRRARVISSVDTVTRLLTVHSPAGYEHLQVQLISPSYVSGAHSVPESRVVCWPGKKIVALLAHLVSVALSVLWLIPRSLACATRKGPSLWYHRMSEINCG